MDCILGPVCKCLEPCAERLGQKVVRHVIYVFRYKKNMKQLEDEKKKLEKLMVEIEEKVKEAGIRGDIVENNVKEWEQKAENMKSEVVDAKSPNESMKCPNLSSRYRMSKQSIQMIDELKKHIEGGKFDKFGHPADHPLELQFPTRNFREFGSRTSPFKKIKDELKNPEVYMVGVFGLGGVGKTTTVNKVCKQLKKDGAFFEVVNATISRDVNVPQIRGQLAEQLKLKFQAETETGRRNELWNRLNNGKNNLVMLDDLWGELDLGNIGIPLKKGKKNCKVILTTRDINVLNKMEVDKYVTVELLPDEEAWNLFTNAVGNDFASDAKLSKVAESVCKKCGGLPLAILVLGGALKGKKEEHWWNNTLNQLNHSRWETIPGISKEMYAPLRLSYDVLKDEANKGGPEKEAHLILLMCCLYPEDAEIPVDFLLFHCIARELLDESIYDTVEKARSKICTLVDVLKARSLLLDGKDRRFVRMHDVIRDVVISSIAKTDVVKDSITQWPAKSINKELSAVSVRFEKLEEVPSELTYPQLHTLRIECKDGSFQFPDNFFSGVGELRILELKGVDMSSTPSLLANLSKLRTVILIGGLLQDMSFLKGLTRNLEVLVIENDDITTLPTELGEFSHLRVLILKWCKKLEVIPAGVISKLTRLEELHFPDEFDSGEILHELTSLTKLTSLSVFMPKDAQVPDLCFRNSLASYRLAVGEKFNYWEKYSERRMIKLVGTTYSDVFTTFLERAEVVHLCRVEGLKNGILDRRDTGLLQVKYLFIKWCNDLDRLSGNNPISSFSKLTRLEVKGCSFKSLFTLSCAKGLQQLEKLFIRDCEMLEEIIGTEGEKDQSNHMLKFSKLETLDLWNLPKLISFGPKVENNTAEGVSLPKGQPLFSEKVQFPSLEDMDLRNLPGLETFSTQVLEREVIFPAIGTLECNEVELIIDGNSTTNGLYVSDLFAMFPHVMLMP